MIAPLSVAAQDAKVGVASAVVPQARGTRPNAEPVVLRVGQDMIADERVITAADGKAQLLFVDGTSLMVGPNSDVVLDRFVFDPETGRGDIAFSATRGVFRLVGGRISKQTAVALRTPTATVGIRGGIGVVETDGQSVSATFLFGDGMSVDSGGVTKSVERPGFTIQAPGGGQPPADPQPASEAALTGQLGALEGAPGQPTAGGGSVSDDDVAATQISQLSSAEQGPDASPPPAGAGAAEDSAAPGEASQQAATQAAAMLAAPLPASDDPAEPTTLPAAVCAGICIDGIVGAGLRGGDRAPFADGSLGDGRLRATTGAGAFDLFVPAAAGPFSIGGANLPASTPFGLASGTGVLTDAGFLLYKLTGADGARQLVFAGPPVDAVPTTGVEAFALDEDFLRQSNLPFIDPIEGASHGRAFIAWNNSAADGQRAFAGGAVVIQGQGSAQRSGAYVLSGSVLTDGAGRPFIRAMLEGAARFDPVNAPSLYSGAVSSADGGGGADFFGAAGSRHFVLESVGVDASDVAVSSGVTRRTNEAQSTFASSAAAFPVPYGPGPRTTRTLNGFLSGVERLQADGSHDYVETQSGDPTKTVIATNAQRNVASASFILDANSDEAILMLGFGEAGAAGRSAFIDDGAFVATASGFLHDGSPVDGRGAIVTSAFFEHSGLLPAGVSFCDCDYLVWGFASADRQRFNGAAAADRSNLGLATFVAGTLSDTTQIVGLPPLAASYQGHVIANVANSLNGPTQYYTAVGSISLTFTFGGGNYELNSVAIANLDGANLSGLGASTSFTGNKYSNSGLTVNGTRPGVGAVSAKIEGAFFGPGTPPANTGGQALVTGSNYLAAGTFGAAQTSVGPPPQ